MINFLQETIEAILDSGHQINDVMFIGSSSGKHRIDWNKFEKIANFEYDNGYGGQEIASDLIVYFNDHTYIDRREYDGSEWWEYNVPKIFNPEDNYDTFDKLTGDGSWRTVEELQNEEEEY